MAISPMLETQTAFVTVKPSEYYQWGSHLYIRDEIIDLFDVLKKLRHHSGHQIRYLHLYCDQLAYSNNIESDGTLCLSTFMRGTAQLRYIHVFARDFLAAVPELKAIRVEHASPVDLLLVYDQAPSFLRIVSNIAGSNDQFGGCEILQDATFCPSVRAATASTAGTAGSACTFAHDLPSPVDAGRIISLANGRVQVNSLPNIPVQEVDPVSAEEMEAFGPDIIRTDNLTHLLQWTFNSAATSITDPTQPYELVASKFRFVNRCSKGSVAQVNLAVNAKAILDRLELPRNTEDTFKTGGNNFVAQLFVPSLNFTDYSTTMASRTSVTIDLEKHINDSTLYNNLVNVANSGVDAMFKGFSISIESPKDKISDYETSAKLAIQSLHDKQSDMSKYEDEVKTASDTFNAELTRYGAVKEAQLVTEAISAGFTLIVGIVTTVATCGAGAPATIATTMAIVNKTYEAGSKLKTVLVAIGKIAKIVYDLSQKLKAAYQSQSSYSFRGATRASNDLSATQALENLKQGATKITSKSLPASATQVIDYIGLNCDWEVFKLNTESAFEKLELSFKDDDAAKEVVKAMIDFRTKLKAQALRGQALIAATREAQDTQQYYYRRLAEKEAREERQAKLGELAKRIAAKGISDTVAWPIYRALLQQDVNTAKQSLFVILHRGLLAIMYGLGIASVPEKFQNKTDKVVFGPNTSALFLRNRFLDLEESYNERELQPNFKVCVGSSEDEGAVFIENWRGKLNEGVIPFTIPSTLESCQDRLRTRIRTIKATFHGLTRSPHATQKKVPKISYSVVVGPSMFDRIADGPIKYWMTPRYVLTQAPALPDENFASPTLFSEGYIFLVKSEVKDWDLSSITDITLDIVCSGTPKGGIKPQQSR